MRTIFYDTKDGAICFHEFDYPRYMGYSLREAKSLLRKQYGLERKHIKFDDVTAIHVGADLIKCLLKLESLQESR